PQVNLLFIYSATMQYPMYYRIVPGNIREVKAFKLILEESSIKDAIIIADKGFYSQSNVAQLQEEQLRFIIPLRRTSNMVDYEPLKSKGNLGGYFKFNNRYIWYYSYPVGNFMLHCFLDEHLKNKEEHDYLNRIEKDPDTYTVENFFKKHLHFGTMAILTNINESSSEEIYTNYKSRNNIEVMIDAMKNILNADSTYMQDEKALEGWMFITFIALQWYYSLYRLLSNKNLLSKFSPHDLLTYLSEIKKVKINDTWYTAEITSKTQKIIDLLDIHIT
ncbi:MAG: transposase, partial [Nitrospirae bacterium]|nr:transposase [Nitrospirota bacterium]